MLELSMNISITRGDDPEACGNQESRTIVAGAIGVEVRQDFTYTHQTHTTNVARSHARG